MIRLLLKRILPDGKQAQDADMRVRCTMLAGILGIVCNLILFVLKVTVGAVLGSIAVTSDAFNNLSDAGASLVAAVGAHLAGQKPDPEHPYGHGRLEYIASLIVSFLILFMGIELLRSSFGKLLQPQQTTLSLIPLLLLILSVLVKVWMWSYNRYIASLIDSPVLRAAAADSITDALSSSVVIAGAVIGSFLPSGIPLDAIMGILISLLILKAGFSIARETVDRLLGAPADAETSACLRQIILSGEDIVGMHDLIIHDYGPGRRFASAHAEIPDTADIRRAHETIDALEVRIFEETGITAVLHTDPVTVGNARVDAIRRALTEEIHAINAQYSIHDFRITEGEMRINLIFDLVVPLHERTEETVENIARIRERILALDPRYRIVCKPEHDYTLA